MLAPVTGANVINEEIIQPSPASLLYLHCNVGNTKVGCDTDSQQEVKDGRLDPEIKNKRIKLLRKVLPERETTAQQPNGNFLTCMRSSPVSAGHRKQTQGPCEKREFFSVYYTSRQHTQVSVTSLHTSFELSSYNQKPEDTIQNTCCSAVSEEAHGRCLAGFTTLL